MASATPLQIASDDVLTSLPGDAVSRVFIPPYSGTVRVRWEIRSGDGSEVTGAARVSNLSNCLRPTASTTFVLKVCTIRVAGGVPIDVRVFPVGGNNIVSMRNVRISYQVVESDGAAITYVVPDER